MFAVCHCNHLINFALLFGATAPIKIHQITFRALTCNGCAFSLAGTTFTFLTFAFFKKLRVKHQAKIFMNLCLAYMFFLNAFRTGSTRTESKIGCQISAFLIQYFMLSVFLVICRGIIIIR